MGVFEGRETWWTDVRLTYTNQRFLISEGQDLVIIVLLAFVPHPFHCLGDLALYEHCLRLQARVEVL